MLHRDNLYLTPIFPLFDTRKQAEFKSLVRWAIDVDPLAIRGRGSPVNATYLIAICARIYWATR